MKELKKLDKPVVIAGLSEILKQGDVELKHWDSKQNNVKRLKDRRYSTYRLAMTDNSVRQFPDSETLKSLAIQWLKKEIEVRSVLDTCVLLTIPNGTSKANLQKFVKAITDKMNEIIEAGHLIDFKGIGNRRPKQRKYVYSLKISPGSLLVWPPDEELVKIGREVLNGSIFITRKAEKLVVFQSGKELSEEDRGRFALAIQKFAQQTA